MITDFSGEEAFPAINNHQSKRRLLNGRTQFHQKIMISFGSYELTVGRWGRQPARCEHRRNGRLGAGTALRIFKRFGVRCTFYPSGSYQHLNFKIGGDDYTFP